MRGTAQGRPGRPPHRTPPPLPRAPPSPLHGGSVAGDQMLVRRAPRGLPGGAQGGDADEHHGADAGQGEGGEAPVALVRGEQPTADGPAALSATKCPPAGADPAHSVGAGPGSRLARVGRMTHSFVVRIPDAELEPEPLEPEQILSGTPEVTGKVVWESPDGRQVRGIWQITPGVVTDTEADELFVVISGSATIEVEGGPTLTVGPGDMAVLREGDRTTWTVHETLRKAYAINL